MSTPSKIAVVGATGRVGRHVVEILRDEGHEVSAISRSAGVDVITGEGLSQALAGADTIIDVATGPSPEQAAATEFFTTATRNLQEEGTRAGVQRLVVISIIGADRFSGGYGAAKIAHEQAALAGPIPARVLRASQFHEFVEQMMDWGRQGDQVYVPQMRTQLVAARTVAEALAALATDSGANGSTSAEIPEIAGPREESLVEVATLYAERRHDPAQIEGVTNPDDPDGALYLGGALLPGPKATLAGPTFEEWLEAAA